MSDLRTKLHPIKKLQLWETIKEFIFKKMDLNIISPERADEILNTVQNEVSNIENPEQAKTIYIDLPKKYPELEPIKQKCQIEEVQAIDNLLVLLLDEFMDKNKIDLASEIMDKINQSKNTDKLITDLKNKYPIEFSLCLKRFSQKFI